MSAWYNHTVRPRKKARFARWRGQKDLRSHALPQPLDNRKYVVPAPGIEANNVLAKFIQNLVHFNGTKNRFDEDGAFDCALGHIKEVLPAIFIKSKRTFKSRVVAKNPI